MPLQYSSKNCFPSSLPLTFTGRFLSQLPVKSVEFLVALSCQIPSRFPSVPSKVPLSVPQSLSLSSTRSVSPVELPRSSPPAKLSKVHFSQLVKGEHVGVAPRVAHIPTRFFFASLARDLHPVKALGCFFVPADTRFTLISKNRSLLSSQLVWTLIPGPISRFSFLLS